MNDWINLSALWKIVVIGLLAGAGLPALFAVGLKALDGPQGSPVAAGAGEVGGRATPIGLAVAGVCFAVVLAAIGWGIYSIVNG